MKADNKNNGELSLDKAVLIAGVKIASRFSSLSGKPFDEALFTPILFPFNRGFFCLSPAYRRGFCKIELLPKLRCFIFSPVEIVNAIARKCQPIARSRNGLENRMC